MAARGSVGRRIRRRAVAGCVVRCFGAIWVVADLLGVRNWGKEDRGEGQGDYARDLHVSIHGEERRNGYVGRRLMLSSHIILPQGLRKNEDERRNMWQASRDQFRGVSSRLRRAVKEHAPSNSNDCFTLSLSRRRQKGYGVGEFQLKKWFRSKISTAVWLTLPNKRVPIHEVEFKNAKTGR